MTERTHIQRFYRQRFAELHTRNLRVNSHRRIRIDITERFGVVWSPASSKWLLVVSGCCDLDAVGEEFDFAPPASPGDTFRFVTRIKTVNRLRKMAKR